MMFVSKIAFAPGDAMNNLKIQGKGMPKEHMAIFGTFLGIISILLPGFIAKKTGATAPFNFSLDFTSSFTTQHYRCVYHLLRANAGT